MRTRTPLLAALATVAIVVAPTVPARAATEPGIAISGNGTIPVAGHGWGHGHGMSQYGAQGAARAGRTYAEILAFYYPGTVLSSFTGSVRVLITADTDNNTTVRATRGLRLTDTGRGKTWTLPTSKRPKAWRLRTKDGHRQVLYKTGRWHRYRPGGHATLLGDGQFSSSRGPVTLRLPSGDRAYRGALRLANRDTVNVVGMEKYLRGVIPSEMSPSWKPAALQAQAVAARSYAAFERAANASRYFQVYDSTWSQVYGGFAVEADTTNAAIAVTAHRILTYGGRPAFTQFSSSSGGWTSAGTRPYLPSMQDIYDKPVANGVGDPNFSWTDEISIPKLRAFYGPGLTSIQITERENNGTAADWGGRAVKVVLNGSAGPKTVSGDSKIRSTFDLKSSYFTFTSP